MKIYIKAHGAWKPVRFRGWFGRTIQSLHFREKGSMNPVQFMDRIAEKQRKQIEVKFSEPVFTFGEMLYSLDAGEETRVVDQGEPAPRVRDMKIVARFDEPLTGVVKYVYAPEGTTYKLQEAM